jgi:hypothetical protein
MSDVEPTQPFADHYDHSAWKDILRFVEERKKSGITGQPYRWNRQELHEEREGRWLHNRFQDEEQA